MTIKEFQVSLEQRVKNMKVFTDPLKIAAFTTTAQMGERIFDEGRKMDESPIINHKAGVGATQFYSEKPTYISKSATPSPKGAMTGKPSGKTRTKKSFKFNSEMSASGTIVKEQVLVGGKSKFANGKPHKSKYFMKGYKEYRENVGRQTAFIDLSMTGELRMDFGNDKTVAQPRKISEVEYQIRLDKGINQEKRGGIEEKYGTIFTLSEKEKELFYETMRFEFANRLSRTK